MATLSLEEAIEFVEPLPKDFECPLCLGVLQDPVLTACGHHYCRKCIDRVVKANGPCPVCKEDNIQVFPDASVKRKIGALQVRCRLKSRGCDWEGALSDLDRHMSEGAREGECRYVSVTCEFSDVGCTAGVLRKDVLQHDEENLHKHLVLMSVMGAKGVLGGSSSERKRAGKQSELERRADLIQQQLKRKEDQMKHQLAESKDQLAESKDQLADITAKLADTKADTTAKLANITAQLADTKAQLQQKDEQIHMLTEQVRVIETRLPKNYPPFEFVMSDFTRHKTNNDTWYSPPFYSHQCGYKQCLAVYANGKGSYQGESVNFELHTMKGEHDEVLTWPRELNTVVEFYNLNTEQWVSPWGACCSHKRYKPTSAMVPSECPHQCSTYNKLVNYLRNDCIQIRIKSVTPN